MEKFPILYQTRWRDVPPDAVRFIRWDSLNEEQAYKNHAQTLKQLAESGGLSPSEAVAIIEGRPWHGMEQSEALGKLRYLELPA